MPTNRTRRRLLRHGGGLTEGQAFHLSAGLDLFGDGFGRAGGFDEAAARAAWAVHGARLTAQQIAEEPGTRPAAWWWFSAPGQRLMLRESNSVGGFGTRQEQECEALDRMGLLTDEERGRLADWQRRYLKGRERANQ